MLMKYARSLALVLALAAPLAARPALALEPPTVAVLDFQQLLKESRAAKDLNEKILAKRKTLRDDLLKDEEKINAAKQELVKQKDIYSQDEFAKKREELEKQLIAFNSKVQAKNKELDDTLNQAVLVMRDGILGIVKTMSAAKGIDIVIAKQQTIFVADSTLDITDEVMAALDAQLPSINITTAAAPAKKGK